jgi:hypothetical protein
MINHIAQRELPIGNTITGIGQYGSGSNAATKFNTILTQTIGVLTIVAGIYFVFLLITGGIEWMASSGDKGKLASARTKMLSGAVGLTIIVAALFVADIVGNIIGLPGITNPGGVLNTLTP